MCLGPIIYMPLQFDSRLLCTSYFITGWVRGCPAHDRQFRSRGNLVAPGQISSFHSGRKAGPELSLQKGFLNSGVFWQVPVIRSSSLSSHTEIFEELMALVALMISLIQGTPMVMFMKGYLCQRKTLPGCLGAKLAHASFTESLHCSAWFHLCPDN